MIRNSSAVITCTPRKGCNRSKSLSPVMIYCACPFNTNSKTLSSLRSRHSCTFSIICTKTERSTKPAKNPSLSSLLTYRLNFSRPNTSFNYSSSSSDSNTSPFAKAYRRERSGLLYLQKKRTDNYIDIKNVAHFTPQKELNPKFLGSILALEHSD